MVVEVDWTLFLLDTVGSWDVETASSFPAELSTTVSSSCSTPPLAAVVAADADTDVVWCWTGGPISRVLIVIILMMDIRSLSTTLLEALVLTLPPTLWLAVAVFLEEGDLLVVFTLPSPSPCPPPAKAR